MLIIFDLDDTLIDSSGSIIPAKLADALRAMTSHGLPVDSFDQACQRLLYLNQHSLNGKEAIQKLVAELKADVKLVEIGIKEYYETLRGDIPINALPGAVKVLQQLQNNNILTVVTEGVREQQLAKMKRAHLNMAVFHKIIAISQPNKKECYQQLMDEFGSVPAEVIVCGDKFKTDLLPAQELGCIAVQMKWGRAVNSTHEVDYSIQKLEELIEIVNKITPQKIS